MIKSNLLYKHTFSCYFKTSFLCSKYKVINTINVIQTMPIILKYLSILDKLISLTHMTKGATVFELLSESNDKNIFLFNFTDVKFMSTSRAKNIFSRLINKGT